MASDQMRAPLGLLLLAVLATARCTSENPELADMCPVGCATADMEAPAPSGMVTVKGSTFQMGAVTATDPQASPNEGPVHSVRVATFYLDRTETTVAAYRLCKAPGCTAPATGMHCNWSDAAGNKENHPVNCVSQVQATAYCAWAGKRLPTEEEWEYAARGTMDSTYAWGNVAPIAPNIGQPQLCWDQAGTCPVGSFADTLLGQTVATGLSDMAGNVWEWMSTKFCNYDGSGCTGDFVLRGSAWNRTDPGDVRAARRNATLATAQPADVGFRCAKTFAVPR